MTTIYLVRHAEAEGNLYRRIHGWYNSKITEKGYWQIAALEKRFQAIHIDAVYSSDLHRTMTTARAVYVPKGLTLHTTPDLREVGMGTWEDLTWGEVARSAPEELKAFTDGSLSWGTVPGSESFPQAQERAWRAIRTIADRHPDQTVAVFCHGMVIRTLLTRFHGRPIEQLPLIRHSDNTGVACVTIDGDRVEVVHESDASHLDESLSTFAGQRWWKEEKGALADANMWFRPLDMEHEGELYRRCRAEAWKTVHGSMELFNGDAFFADACRNWKVDPHGVTCAMLDDQPAGVIQMDFERQAAEKVGWIPFYYVFPERRGQGMGIQLLGEAVSRFRSRGREKLRLRCAPENTIAQKFYRSHGFEKIGEDPTSPVPLDILESILVMIIEEKWQGTLCSVPCEFKQR